MKDHKNNPGSYYINAPKELIKELKWRDDQNVVIRKRGRAILIEDSK